jgi:hypothetical protein
LITGVYITHFLIQNHRNEQKFRSIAKKLPNNQAVILPETEKLPPSSTEAPHSASAEPKMNEYTEFPETELFAEKFDFNSLDLSKIMQTVNELFPALKSYFKENLLEYLMEMKSMSNKEIFALLSSALEKISEEDLRSQLKNLKSEFETLEPVGAECETLINKIRMLFKYLDSIHNRELVNNLGVFLILIKSSISKSEKNKKI